jgi:formylglycine-generating enzyme required for sulfatase activity
MTLNDQRRRTLSRLLEARSDSLRDLARIAGLDPARHFRRSSWRGIDFGIDDLSGFDFSQSDITGADFSRVTGLADAIFHGAVGHDEARWPEDYVRRPDRFNPGAEWRQALPGMPTSAGVAMVTLPPGRFRMGASKTEEGTSSDERPVHDVHIAHAFAIGKYPVTFAQWDAGRAAGANLAEPSDEGWGREDRPVINVSWDDVREWIDWFNARLGLARRPDAYRLPSEAEWEYACRAGTTTPFSFGRTISPLDANYDVRKTYGKDGVTGEYLGRTTPVGQYPANRFGLHDMHGNVWEWCEDTWHDSYRRAPADGSAWLTGNKSLRVVRGGSWLSLPLYLRSADRGRNLRTIRDNDVGFRLARTLSPRTS